MNLPGYKDGESSLFPLTAQFNGLCGRTRVAMIYGIESNGRGLVALTCLSGETDTRLTKDFALDVTLNQAIEEFRDAKRQDRIAGLTKFSPK